MKLNYCLKLFVLVALMTLVVNVNAKEIVVADGASDTELAAALEQAETGDVILINGWVTMNNMVHVEKNVTIKVGPAAPKGMGGFDGQGLTRLFEIHPEPIDGAKLVFDGLDFTGGNGHGSDPTDGGVARIYAGVTEFNSCYFYDNEAIRGGAFFIAETGTTVTFRHCEATNNIAAGSYGESRGGYLFTDGETHINHEYCKISGNQSIGNRGGALCLFGSGTHRFYYCMISDNQGGSWDEDALTKLDKNGDPTTEGEYEGGVAFIDGSVGVTFESCGIVGNKSWSHGGIIRGFGSHNATFINCTLARNQSLHDRSPLWIGGSSTYTFVNSLVVENLGQNSGNGAGFDFDGANVKLNIFNSVFSRNVAGDDGAVDIRNASNYATQLVVKNSLIGLIQGNSSVVVPQDNASIPTKSNVNMYKLSADEMASLDYASLESSGVHFNQGIRYSKPFGMPYYLLISGSPVTKLGDPALLADFDIDSDLFGQTHPIAADGSITAAPTLASVTDDFPDEVGIDDLPAISVANENISVIAASNGTLGINYGNLKGAAKGTLLSVTGQEVEHVFNTTVVGKGFYNIHVAPGLYILKVEIGGKAYACKLIVTK